MLDRFKRQQVIGRIATVARTCYKSEAMRTADRDEALVKRLIESKHEAMLEFVDVTVKFTTSIGITREIIRHRMASFANESTRYCNYSKDKFNGELTFIIPSWLDIPEGDWQLDSYWDVDSNKTKLQLPVEEGTAASSWLSAMEHAETAYRILTNKGWKAEQAREVLPMCTKSEICMKANLREWRHFFKLRCHHTAHPDIRVLALDLLKQMHERIPIVFDDLYKEFIEDASKG